MRYWLNLFSVSTWDDFRNSGGGVTGFRANNWARAKSIQLGDRLLCYIVGVKRWVGILRVVGERYFDESERIFKDDTYPVRFQVEPIVMLDPECGIPMEDLRGKLTFFPAEGTSRDWSGRVRSSPTKFSDQDGDVIRVVLESAAREPVIVPIDPKVAAMPRKKDSPTVSPSAEPISMIGRDLDGVPDLESVP